MSDIIKVAVEQVFCGSTSAEKNLRKQGIGGFLHIDFVAKVILEAESAFAVTDMSVTCFNKHSVESDEGLEGIFALGETLPRNEFVSAVTKDDVESALEHSLVGVDVVHLVGGGGVVHLVHFSCCLCFSI